MANGANGADGAPDAAAAAPAKSGGKFVLALGATALVAAGAGAAAPLLLLSKPAEPQSKVVLPSYEPPPPDRVEFLTFGDVTVNLNEGRLNRYLRLKISLQIDRLQLELVTKAIDKQKLILRNWLLSHLSDKDMEEIRGAAGQNMLRREIRDHFNTVLFTDGYDRVYDVLFEEFNIQ